MSLITNGIAPDSKVLSPIKLNSSDIDFDESSLGNIFNAISKNKTASAFKTNPFDTSFWEEDNLKNIAEKAKSAVSLFSTSEISSVKPKFTDSNTQNSLINTDSIFNGIQINQGTGMVNGDDDIHQLDFKY